MAQTGKTPISLYYSTTGGNTPTAGNLVDGELAINTADGKLFYKDNLGVVQTIAQKGGNGVTTFSGGTTGLTPNTATAGAITLDGTLAVANGGTGSTTSTGSGSVVLQTSPSITTPTIDKINTSVANTSIGAGNASIMKNRIINGAMVIDQRNAGASVTPTNGSYNLDRWSAYLTQASKYTVQQNAGSVTPPVGFRNYLGVTSSSAYSVLSTDFFFLSQPIEGYNIADLGWGTASAKTVTLSFQVYSSLTGTFGGSISNSATNRSYPFTYSIPVANTWTTISVTIAGDTSGTWNSTNGVGMYVNFGLGVGSTNSGTAGSWAGSTYWSATGATSVVGTNGATFYITGVQLEVGSSATGYEYVNYQTSLANCQRYFQSYGGVSANDMVCMGLTSSTSLSVAILQLPVTMRTSPSVGYSSTSALIVDDNGAAGTSSAISTSSLGLTSIYFTVTTGATLVANRPARIYTNGSGARLTWSAEL